VTLASYYDESYPPSLWGGGSGADPHINVIDPNPGIAVGSPITFTVHGSGFSATSVVEVDHVPQTTTFVNGTTLTFILPPVPGTFEVTVRNADEQESNSVTLEVWPGTVTAEQVSGWTIDEVKAFIVAHPDLLSEVHEFEQHGRKRAGLLTWLEQLLDEEDVPDEDDD